MIDLRVVGGLLAHLDGVKVLDAGESFVQGRVSRAEFYVSMFVFGDSANSVNLQVRCNSVGMNELRSVATDDTDETLALWIVETVKSARSLYLEKSAQMKSENAESNALRDELRVWLAERGWKLDRMKKYDGDVLKAWLSRKRAT